MLPLNNYVHSQPFLDTEGKEIVRQRQAAIAAALRNPGVVDGLFAVARVPKILRGLVRPYVERALAAVADWIDPATPDPKP